jgi:hypothetical protein
MRWRRDPHRSAPRADDHRRYHVSDSRRDDESTPHDGVNQPDTTVRDPLVGVHGRPLGPRRMERDPEEEDAEPALSPRLDPSLDTPTLRPAVLGRLEGLGLMTLLHDASGAEVQAEGTWRPADETATLQELRETFPEGSVTTFAGTLVESRHVGAGEDVSMQVVITRHGEYDDVEGGTLRVVNFVRRDDRESSGTQPPTPGRLSP